MTLKIYTKTGDQGETSLFDGTRVSKADARVDTYGDVDELQAWLGLARATGAPERLGVMLEQIQRDLFALGAQLADPQHRIAARVTKAVLSPADVTALEELRRKYREQVSKAGGNLTVTAMLVRVLATAVKKFPQFNASLDT